MFYLLKEEAKNLGFKLNYNEWGGIKHDFQLLGYRFVTGYYKDKHKIEVVRNVEN